MAAGLGFKTFNTGDVLSAADVNGYLMQGILVFASATARDAAITSPEEGQFAFLKDTNVTTYYTGSAWANVDTTGMTNPMTTTGDVIYSSSGSTPARLGIGTAGQVLKVNAGATAPEWGTAASGGGLTLLATATPSAAASFNFTSISGSYKNLLMVWKNFQASAGGTFATMTLNNDTGSNYDFQTLRIKSQGSNIAVDAADSGPVTSMMGGTSANQAFGGQFGGIAVQTAGRGWLRIWNYTGSNFTNYDWHSKSYDNTVPQSIGTHGWGGYNNSAAITQIDVTASGGTLTGTCYLYGES